MAKKVGTVAVAVTVALLSIVGLGNTQTAGLPVLLIQPGIRPAALADAYVGLGDDVNAIWTNPAGIINVSKVEVTANYTSWIADVGIMSIGGVLPRGKLVFGGGLLISGMPPIEEVLETGAKSGKELNYQDIVFGGYGATTVKVGDKNLQVGAGAKIISQALAGYSSLSLALDAGAVYPISDKIKVGAALQNVGMMLKAFVEEKDALPLTLKAGIGAKAFSTPNDINVLNVAADLSQPLSGGKTKINIGAEFIFNKMIAVRGGYKIASAGDLGGLVLGAGVKIKNIQLDFVYSPMGDVGSAWRVGGIFRLGK
jgi:hypothetical protein